MSCICPGYVNYHIQHIYLMIVKPYTSNVKLQTNTCHIIANLEEIAHAKLKIVSSFKQSWRLYTIDPGFQHSPKYLFVFNIKKNPMKATKLLQNFHIYVELLLSHKVNLKN